MEPSKDTGCCAGSHSPGDHAVAAPDDNARDPVCGMTVRRATAKWTTEHDGQDYFFCNERCLTRFREAPDRYLRPEPAPALEPAVSVAATKHEYVCPMHPEVIRDEPGACPICGMALEPRTATLEEPPNLELIDMSRRLWWSIAPTAIVVLLGMSDLVPGQPLARLVPLRALQGVELVLVTPVVLWAGWPFFERGVASIVRRRLNMFTLIALGTGTAYVFSVVATIAPSIFPASFRGMDGVAGVYFEAAAAITVLVLVGQVLELRARGQTGSAIRALLQ